MIHGILRRIRRDDGGYVMPMVLGASLVMIALVATALVVTLSGSVKSNTDARWTASLAAAYAGLEDYKSRLENDIAYVRYGNDDSPFSAGSSLVVPTGADANPAFNIAANQPWAVVPGTDGQSQFRYEVNNADFSGTGVIRIRATGKVGDSTRSIVADLLQNGFTDYVYFTGYETSDPILTTASDDNCKAYAWNRPTSCAEIQFASGDILHGKVHSNDRIYLNCGATFENDVTTGYNTPPYYKIAGGTTETQQYTTSTGVVPATSCKKTATPTTPGQDTFKAKKPHPVNPINIGDPRVMLQEMRYDIPDTVPDPGCLYTGPTTVKLLSNGKMTVWSPFTKVTQIKGPAAEPWKPTEGRQAPSNYCGAPADLQSVAGATIPVPTNNAVYVQNVPNDTSNPNYSAVPTVSNSTWTFTTPNTPSGSKTQVKCTWNSGTSFSDSRSQQSWSFTNSSGSTTIAKHPIDNEAFPSTSIDGNPAYGCRKGDLYIVGGSVLDGRVTLAAENAVYILGDVTLKDRTLGSDDMLGIVGTGSIWIANPVNSSGTNLFPTCAAALSDAACASSLGRSIDASLLSAQHTVLVQNWDKGVRTGALHIKGSIAQLFRGPVGQSGSPMKGYLKDYQYDGRLTYSSPPKFLMPTSTVFGISQIEGSGAAYSSDGAPR